MLVLAINQFPRGKSLQNLIAFALSRQCLFAISFQYMKIGYARVSKLDGNGKRHNGNGHSTVTQIQALRAAGCERVFEEVASGGRWDRPELHRLLDTIRQDDVLVVWKLDRLSRSLRDLLTIMEQLARADAGFQSLTEAIDTTTPAGRMLMQMVGAFAEFERAMIRERTRAGLETARSQGRIGGRRPKLKSNQAAEVLEMVNSGKRRLPK